MFNGCTSINSNSLVVMMLKCCWSRSNTLSTFACLNLIISTNVKVQVRLTDIYLVIEVIVLWGPWMFPPNVIPMQKCLRVYHDKWLIWPWMFKTYQSGPQTNSGIVTLFGPQSQSSLKRASWEPNNGQNIITPLNSAHVRQQEMRVSQHISTRKSNHRKYKAVLLIAMLIITCYIHDITE